MELILAFIAGAAALAGYQIYRGKKAGLSLKDAGKAVIQGGGGPGSGETPK